MSLNVCNGPGIHVVKLQNNISISLKGGRAVVVITLNVLQQINDITGI